MPSTTAVSFAKDGRSEVGEMRASGEICCCECEFFRIPVNTISKHSILNEQAEINTVPFGLLGASGGECGAGASFAIVQIDVVDVL